MPRQSLGITVSQGIGIRLTRGYPRDFYPQGFGTQVVSDWKSKQGRTYRTGSVFRRRLACKSKRIGQPL